MKINGERNNGNFLNDGFNEKTEGLSDDALHSMSDSTSSTSEEIPSPEAEQILISQSVHSSVKSAVKMKN